MCIKDHYPLGNQRPEISGVLNISEKLGRDSWCLIPDLLILHLAILHLAIMLCYLISQYKTCVRKLRSKKEGHKILVSLLAQSQNERDELQNNLDTLKGS